MAGLLLTALGRLLVAFLQISGHTCGIEDLTLTREADKVRYCLIKEVCVCLCLGYATGAVRTIVVAVMQTISTPIPAIRLEG